MIQAHPERPQTLLEQQVHCLPEGHAPILGILPHFCEYRIVDV
jgi:hypothetical protein